MCLKYWFLPYWDWLFFGQIREIKSSRNVWGSPIRENKYPRKTENSRFTNISTRKIYQYRWFVEISIHENSRQSSFSKISRREMQNIQAREN